LHFSSSPSTALVEEKSDSLQVKKIVVKAAKDIKESKIVYVNTDVLNESYELVKDLSSSIKSKQQALDSKYQAKGAAFQKKYMDFQENTSKGLLSENQSLTVQNELVKQKEELDNMEAQLQTLMDKMQKDNEIVLKNVMEYIKAYNETGNYNYILAYSSSAMSPVLIANESFDITAEIVDGLNEQYRAEKAAKNK
jgi:outer membrane protein